MIAVGVGENQRVEIAQRVSEERKIALQRLPKPGKTSVDRRQPVSFFDQVPVDQRAPEPVDSGDDVTLYDDRLILAAPSGETAPGQAI